MFYCEVILCVFRSHDRPAVHREGPGDVPEGLHQSRGEQTAAGQTVRERPDLIYIYI